MSKQISFYKKRLMREGKKVIHLVIVALFLLLAHNALAESKNANPYQGNIFGEWSGIMMSQFVNGTFSMKIAADGSLSGSFNATGAMLGSKPADITGSVDADGNLKAKSNAVFGELLWEGKLILINGKLNGGGSVKASSVDVTWNTK